MAWSYIIGRKRYTRLKVLLLKKHYSTNGLINIEESYFALIFTWHQFKHKDIDFFKLTGQMLNSILSDPMIGSLRFDGTVRHFGDLFSTSLCIINTLPWVTMVTEWNTPGHSLLLQYFMSEDFAFSHSWTVALRSQFIFLENNLQLSTTFSILSKHSTQDA